MGKNSPLKEINLLVMEKKLGIYIHIPYCASKCPYCDFVSVTSATVPEDIYIDALLKELSQRLSNYPALREKRVGSLYIGGGTPSLFSSKCIMRLIEEIRKKLSFVEDIEITIEANPGTVNTAKLRELRYGGINRLSLGVQSLNDRLLSALGRTHSSNDALTAFHSAREAGFDNIGIDLIFGIPGQNIVDWQMDMGKLLDLRPEHVSLYALTIEEGTPFHKNLSNLKTLIPSEEVTVDMYRSAIKTLTEAGYGHYEISNLAIPGYRSRHNQVYWDGGDYIGLGSGAHSYLSIPEWGKRWWNVDDPARYIYILGEGRNIVAGGEDLTLEAAFLEALFLGLRRVEGIRIDSFIKKFGFSPLECLPIDSPKLSDLVAIGDNIFRLTQKGILFSNEVFSYIKVPGTQKE